MLNTSLLTQLPDTATVHYAGGYLDAHIQDIRRSRDASELTQLNVISMLRSSSIKPEDIIPSVHAYNKHTRTQALYAAPDFYQVHSKNCSSNESTDIQSRNSAVCITSLNVPKQST